MANDSRPIRPGEWCSGRHGLREAGDKGRARSAVAQPMADDVCALSKRRRREANAVEQKGRGTAGAARAGGWDEACWGRNGAGTDAQG